MESRSEASEEAISKSEAQKPDFEANYKFFQDMRGYVRDLVECLNEKVGVFITVKLTQSDLPFFTFFYLMRATDFINISIGCLAGSGSSGRGHAMQVSSGVMLACILLRGS